MSRRVVVTGLGAVTPIGNNVDLSLIHIYADETIVLKKYSQVGSLKNISQAYAQSPVSYTHLSHVIAKLPRGEKDSNLLIGYDSCDDAAVYKISDDTAVVQTLDFFPPMVDDPYTVCLLYTSVI